MLPVPSSRMCFSIPPFSALLISKPFSSIVGRPRHQGVMVGMGQKDSYVGYGPLLICPHLLADVYPQ